MRIAFFLLTIGLLVGCNGSNDAPNATPMPTADLSDPNRFPYTEIPASQDAVLYESASGDVANGEGEHLVVGATSGSQDQLRRIVVKFPVEQYLGADTQVEATSLCFSLSQSLGQSVTFQVFRILTEWHAGSTDPTGDERHGAQAMDDDVTWLRTGTGASWANPGGDFDATPDLEKEISSTDGDVCFVDSDGEGALSSTIESWIVSPEANFGWLIKSTESGGGLLRGFNSSESSVSTLHPVLVVTH